MFSVVNVTFIGCCLLLVIIFWDDDFSSSSNSRLIIFLYWVFVSFATIMGRLAARVVQRRLRSRGVIRIPALLAGCSSKVADLQRSIDGAPALGYEARGVVLRDDDDVSDWQQRNGDNGLPVLGTLPALPPRSARECAA